MNAFHAGDLVQTIGGPQHVGAICTLITLLPKTSDCWVVMPIDSTLVFIRYADELELIASCIPTEVEP